MRVVWLILHQAESRNVTAYVSLNRWILCFIVEARNQEGKPYPLSSLQNFVININQAPLSIQGDSSLIEQEFDEVLESVDLEY